MHAPGYDTSGLPTWNASQAAIDAYGKHLPDIRFIASLLAGYQSDREALTERLTHGQDAVLSEVHLLAMEARDELLETGAVLDALALSCTPGPYLPGEEPYDDVPEPVDSAVELRTDAAMLAERLVAHDRIHGGGKTSRPPQPRTDGDRDAERDSARAYLRREWIATREVRFGGRRLP
ncbi:hypothetical protein ACFCYM_12490 [Streptomyces sp. NPDC056254]|uniref:hypothetical protein n=1 Tax=Streptomyces sp. NPDC056254 TaxID=3345763 RepID=UPI0035D6A546